MFWTDSFFDGVQLLLSVTIVRRFDFYSLFFFFTLLLCFLWSLNLNYSMIETLFVKILIFIDQVFWLENSRLLGGWSFFFFFVFKLLKYFISLSLANSRDLWIEKKKKKITVYGIKLPDIVSLLSIKYI